MRLRYIVVAGLLGAACASGPPLLLGQPIKKEVAILVHVSGAAAHGDQFGGIGALVDAVSDGLGERGVRSQIYAADDDHPGTPRIEITVQRWGIGDVTARAVTNGIVGVPIGSSGSYDVVVKYYRDGDTRPTCTRDFTGSVGGTNYEASADEGGSVGRHILSQALSKTCG
ncbi:MAG TPA: hypothetical protein VNN72_07280 [Polyangiaceae bacterium]|nr:hypothetical protein [Polyangiaceae bacterium]